MIKKYNDFLNEKLSDNLKGFDENELKQQFLKGKIDLQKYLRICNKYEYEFPTKEEIENIFVNDLMNIEFYFLLCKNYHYDFPNFDDTKQKFLDKKITCFVFVFICKEYYNIEITSIFIDNLLVNNEINIKEYLGLIREYKLKINDELIIKYINENENDINFYELVTFAINNDNLSLLKISMPYEKIEFTQIKRSILYKSINCFKYLINYATDYEKNESLKITCTTDTGIQFTKYLIENGADIHYENEYALKQAIDDEQIETIKYLLENGAIVTDKILKKSEINEEEIIKQLVKKYYNLQHDKKI